MAGTEVLDTKKMPPPQWSLPWKRWKWWWVLARAGSGTEPMLCSRARGGFGGVAAVVLWLEAGVVEERSGLEEDGE